MTENEVKAIKWIKNVRDDAVVTLDYIKDNEPNVNPMFYAGRKEKAETILAVFEEVQQYRAIGTVEECREAVERMKPRKPIEYEDKFYGCPQCGNPLLHKWKKYPTPTIPTPKIKGLPCCLNCLQAIDWGE